MRHIICLLVLGLLPGQLVAKAPKLYRCVEANGNVVIQDRRCEVTRLQNQSANKVISRPNIKKPSTRKPAKRPSNRLATAKKPASHRKSNPQVVTALNELNVSLNSEWRRDERPGFLRITRSQGNQEQAVTLTAYQNTERTLGRGAFAQALNLYHQIRDDARVKLRDSGFKNHARYKVFNIEYQSAGGLKSITEFYVDEDNNDLFVLKVVATPGQWNAHWRLAEQLIRQL